MEGLNLSPAPSRLPRTRWTFRSPPTDSIIAGEDTKQDDIKQGKNYGDYTSSYTPTTSSSPLFTTENSTTETPDARDLSGSRELIIPARGSGF